MRINHKNIHYIKYTSLCNARVRVASYSGHFMCWSYYRPTASSQYNHSYLKTETTSRH